MKIIRFIVILPILLYQKLISPMFPPSCIYHPSCSNYTMEAVKKHGIIRGLVLGSTRISRCTNIFFSGGDDPPPQNFSFSHIKWGYRHFYKNKVSKDKNSPA